MGGSAIAMFAFGAIFLWGGLLVSAINYIRVARREKAEG